VCVCVCVCLYVYVFYCCCLYQVLGDTDNGLYLDVLTQTAECLRAQGKTVDAETALRQVLLTSKSLYDQQKHVVVAEALTSLAIILLDGEFSCDVWGVFVCIYVCGCVSVWGGLRVDGCMCACECVSTIAELFVSVCV
jgi:hypothetical protein